MEKRDCAFQYYDGSQTVCDKAKLTLEEAKELWNDYYDNMVRQTRYGYEIEAAIWINMKDEWDYKDSLIHIDTPDIDEDGDLFEKKYFGKFV